MEEQPISSLLKATMENLKSMMDVSTVIGDPIESADGTLILPISKVTVGFGSGGGEYSMKTLPSFKEKEHALPFGGGSGAGISIKPIGFLIIKEDKVRLMPMEFNDSTEKLIDIIPDFFEIFKRANKNKKVKIHTEEVIRKEE